MSLWGSDLGGNSPHLWDLRQATHSIHHVLKRERDLINFFNFEEPKILFLVLIIVTFRNDNDGVYPPDACSAQSHLYSACCCWHSTYSRGFPEYRNHCYCRTEPNRLSNLVDPQHSLQSRHGVDGTLGSPGEIKNVRSKIMGSPGVRKNVCVSYNRSMILRSRLKMVTWV